MGELSLLSIVLIASAALLGFGAAFLLWGKRKPVIDVAPAKRRFRVIFSTNRGAVARSLWERVAAVPKSDAVIEFWDGDACRGRKGSK